MQIPVLIVGGGPAGLIAALEPTRRGVGVRLIEQSMQPSSASRAKVFNLERWRYSSRLA